MTNTNHPARQQGNTISRKLYYQEFDEVRRVVQQLRAQAAFKSASPADVDERGSFVIITYVDPMVVSAPRPRPSADVVPIAPSRKLALPQRPVPVAKPLHKRWWFVPSMILSTVAMMCGAGYWAFQQLKQLSAPNIGVGLLGFAFVLVLAVWAVKNLRGGGGSGGHSGGHGFHYGPCD